MFNKTKLQKVATTATQGRGGWKPGIGAILTRPVQNAPLRTRVRAQVRGRTPSL